MDRELRLGWTTGWPELSGESRRDSAVTFVYDPATHMVTTSSKAAAIATAAPPNVLIRPLEGYPQVVKFSH